MIGVRSGASALLLVLLAGSWGSVSAKIPVADPGWTLGRGSAYGLTKVASGATVNGSCGYGDLSTTTYPGNYVAAVLPLNPASQCGSCVQVRCAQANCTSLAPIVVQVVGTCENCSPNEFSVPADLYAGRWLPVAQQPVFLQYRQVPCTPAGDIVVRVVGATPLPPPTAGYTLSLGFLAVAGPPTAIAGVTVLPAKASAWQQLLPLPNTAIWRGAVTGLPPYSVRIQSSLSQLVVMDAVIPKAVTGDYVSTHQLTGYGGVPSGSAPLIAPATAPAVPPAQVPAPAPAKTLSPDVAPAVSPALAPGPGAEAASLRVETTMQFNGTNIAPLSADNLAVIKSTTSKLLANVTKGDVNVTSAMVPASRRMLRQTASDSATVKVTVDSATAVERAAVLKALSTAVTSDQLPQSLTKAGFKVGAMSLSFISPVARTVTSPSGGISTGFAVAPAPVPISDKTSSGGSFGIGAIVGVAISAVFLLLLLALVVLCCVKRRRRMSAAATKLPLYDTTASDTTDSFSGGKGLDKLASTGASLEALHVHADSFPAGTHNSNRLGEPTPHKYGMSPSPSPLQWADVRANQLFVKDGGDNPPSPKPTSSWAAGMLETLRKTPSPLKRTPSCKGTPAGSTVTSPVVEDKVLATPSSNRRQLEEGSPRDMSPEVTSKMLNVASPYSPKLDPDSPEDERPTQPATQRSLWGNVMGRFRRTPSPAPLSPNGPPSIETISLGASAPRENSYTRAPASALTLPQAVLPQSSEASAAVGSSSRPVSRPASLSPPPVAGAPAAKVAAPETDVAVAAPPQPSPASSPAKQGFNVSETTRLLESPVPGPPSPLPAGAMLAPLAAGFAASSANIARRPKSPSPSPEPTTSTAAIDRRPKSLSPSPEPTVSASGSRSPLQARMSAALQADQVAAQKQQAENANSNTQTSPAPQADTVTREETAAAAAEEQTAEAPVATKSSPVVSRLAAIKATLGFRTSSPPAPPRPPNPPTEAARKSDVGATPSEVPTVQPAVGSSNAKPSEEAPQPHARPSRSGDLMPPPPPVATGRSRGGPSERQAAQLELLAQRPASISRSPAIKTRRSPQDVSKAVRLSLPGSSEGGSRSPSKSPKAHSRHSMERTIMYLGDSPAQSPGARRVQRESIGSPAAGSPTASSPGRRPISLPSSLHATPEGGPRVPRAYGASRHDVMPFTAEELMIFKEAQNAASVTASWAGSAESKRSHRSKRSDVSYSSRHSIASQRPRRADSVGSYAPSYESHRSHRGSTIPEGVREVLGLPTVPGGPLPGVPRASGRHKTARNLFRDDLSETGSYSSKAREGSRSRRAGSDAGSNPDSLRSSHSSRAAPSGAPKPRTWRDSPAGGQEHFN